MQRAIFAFVFLSLSSLGLVQKKTGNDDAERELRNESKRKRLRYGCPDPVT